MDDRIKMMRFSVRSFRRLQWQLSRSYTLVAVGALLVVELVLLSAFIVLLNSDVMPNLLVRTFREQFGVNLRPYLDRPTPDLDGLDRYLSAYITQPAVDARQDSQVWTAHQATQNLVVVDAHGNLLWSQLPVAGTPPGQLFDLAQVPGAAELMPRALAGERQAETLYQRVGVDLLVMTIPVESEADAAGQRRVLGVMIFQLQMPSFTNPAFLLELLPTVLISLLLFTLAAGLVGSLFGFFTARHLTQRLAHISHAADAWSHGNFSNFIRDQSDDELGDLAGRLNSMAGLLENQMETRQELAALRERNRIARDLHDSVKQQIFAAAMQLGAARALLPDDHSPAARRLAEAEQLTHQAQAELTDLIHELRPAALEGKGFALAMREMCATWSRQSGIPAQFTCAANLDPHRLDPDKQQALFRVTQEALANIARHSQARTVQVNLSGSGEHASLAVIDDGRGFDPPAARKAGYGLHSMHERIESLGGQMKITSAPEHGACLTFTIPFAGIPGPKKEDTP